MRILITGANAPGTSGTVWSLLQNDFYPNPLTLFGSDQTVGVQHSEFEDISVLPSGSQPDYIRKLNEYCEANEIDIVLPQTTSETIALSSRPPTDFYSKIAILKPYGAAMSLTSKVYTYNSITQDRKCKYDYKIIHNQEQLNSAVQETDCLDYFLKADQLSGGRGIVRIVSDVTEKLLSKTTSYHVVEHKNAEKVLSKLMTSAGVVFQQTQKGIEYSVDCYRDENIFIAIPRTRDTVRAGVSQATTVVEQSQIIDMAQEFAAREKIIGLFGLQCILLETGEISFLECNPRVQGSMVASTIAGENLIWRAILNVMGQDQPALKEITWGAKFQRTWSGIGEANGRMHFI
jgi:carbamoyl-phosphate synthase large subunit